VAISFMPGEKIWVMEKGKMLERTVQGQFPYHIHTDLLDGEPTSDSKTGMFITFHHHLKCEVGKTREEMLLNIIASERERISSYRESVDKCERRIKELQFLLEGVQKGYLKNYE
jgi:hypothetical protein